MWWFNFIHLSYQFNYESEIIRGVNLGGWLVLEPWITPSLFEPYEHLGIIDEYTLCKKLGKSKCESLLQTHWSSFVTEQDIKKIKEANLNHIRIPIGYWAFDVDNEPYIQGQVPHMLRVLKLARKYNLRVILDLHGAPGSQNGFDNSGQRLPKQLWSIKEENIKRTIEVLKRMIIQFKSYEDITSLAILNEPHGGQISLHFINEFYFRVFKELRPLSSMHFWFGDGFFPQHWTHLNNLNKVGIDSHFYYVFEYGMMQAGLQDFSKVENVICNARKDQLLKGLKNDNYSIPHMVGEWSGALTDCAKWLNGIGIGSRWDGTYEQGQKVGDGLSCKDKENSLSWTSEYKNQVKRFIELQMRSYESKGGWIFWNFKTEQADSWNYLKGVDQGYIPKNPNILHNYC